MNISNVSLTSINSPNNISFKSVTTDLKETLIGLSALACPLDVNSSPYVIIPDDVKIETKIPPSPEYWMSNHPSFFVADCANDAVMADINTGKFKRALRENKEKLKKDLHISNETFAVYEKAINRIGQEEHLVMDLGNSCDEKGPFDIVKPERPSVLEDYPALSRLYILDQNNYIPLDMTRFHIDALTEKEARLLAKYGVDFSDKNITPEKRAIGTIIHLNTLAKEYPNYLKSVRENSPDKNNDAVIKSIKNAKSIMDDDFLSLIAVAEFDLPGSSNSLTPFSNGRKLSLTKQDMNDLRTYAKSIELTKGEYLVEMWDSHPILAFGDDEDSACANLLSIVKDFR